MMIVWYHECISHGGTIEDFVAQILGQWGRFERANDASLCK